MTDLQPITFPEGNVTPQWIDSFTQQLIKASWRGQAALPQLLQPETVIAILDSVHRLLIERPALVQVSRKRTYAAWGPLSGFTLIFTLSPSL